MYEERRQFGIKVKFFFFQKLFSFQNIWPLAINRQEVPLRMQSVSFLSFPFFSSIVLSSVRHKREELSSDHIFRDWNHQKKDEMAFGCLALNF